MIAEVIWDMWYYRYDNDYFHNEDEDDHSNYYGDEDQYHDGDEDQYHDGDECDSTYEGSGLIGADVQEEFEAIF